MVKSLVFFCFNFFFCRNGTAYLILVRIGLQYTKGWLGAILLKMTQLSCIAIAWQYFSAAWFKWIYPQEPTTRIHKIFVLFIEFHVVSKFPRNKDGQKLRERTNRHFISFSIKATGRKFGRNIFNKLAAKQACCCLLQIDSILPYICSVMTTDALTTFNPLQSLTSAFIFSIHLLRC